MQPIKRKARAGERGFMLAALMFAVAIMLLFLAIAAPRVAMELKHERELETMHRGQQYAQAIRRYYLKFGAYPNSIDQLSTPINGVRFLRKKYIDPMTGKADWKPIPVGMNKTQVTGFFGQPLAGSGASNLGTAAGMVSGNQGTGIGIGQTGSAFGGLGNGPGISGSSGGFGSSPPQSGSGGGFGGGSGAGNPGSGTPSNGTQGGGTGDGSGGTGGTTPSGGDGSPGGGFGGSSGAGSGTGGLSGAGATGSGFGGTGTGVGGPGAPGTGNGFGTVGGLPMMGVSSMSPKSSIIEFRKMTHYNEWEFIYDPRQDQQKTGSLLGGAPAAPSVGGGLGGAPVGTAPGAPGTPGGSGFGGGSTGGTPPPTPPGGTTPNPGGGFGGP